jgi:hypothetical protein
MSTRSGKVYTRSNNQRLVTKNTSKKNNIPLVIEEDCTICQEVLNDGQTPVTTLTNCNHKFHEPCINGWINSQRNSHLQPNCPICRTNIDIDQLPQQQQQPQIQQQVQQQPQIQQQVQQQQQQPQIPESLRRLQQVTQFEQNAGQPVPFLGVVVCINGQMIRKYLNTDFGLGTNNTLNELKTAILGYSSQIAELRGFCLANVTLPLNNLLSRTGITTHREPSFKINRIGFGVPLSCNFNFTATNYNGPDLGVASLGDIYYRYQEEARLILEESEYEIPNLQSVYYTHTIYYDTTGPDDPGFSDTNYFLNNENPIILAPFRPPYNGIDSRATRHSLAWLVVDIECNTFAGGKTKKTRFKKGNKSIKKGKNMKSKNTKGKKKTNKKKY